MEYYDEIAKVAYGIFETQGRIHGRDFEHWIEAEMIVTMRYRGSIGDEQNDTKVSKPKKSVVAKTATQRSIAKPKTTATSVAKSKTKKTSKK